MTETYSLNDLRHRRLAVSAASRSAVRSSNRRCNAAITL
ncbi:MAG: hypothetical protein QOG25_749 [Acetobacteraceae bacterium]|jgi:Arc/MetJ family transcription regulator|nr:hypothetical protein [Acetobacteraceae bacterium]